MSYAYKLNEDVLHRPQGPQGRAVTDPPTIYTIVRCMPIEADGRLRYLELTPSDRTLSWFE